MNPEEKSRIEELKKSLYARNAPDIRTHRRLKFTEDEQSDIKKDWETKASPLPNATLNSEFKDNSMSFFTKLLIASIIFCLIAVGIGAYIFFNGGNFISADNIDITISGPISVPGGEPTTFDVSVNNNNNVDLQLVDMLIEFPAGSINPNNPSQELTKIQELLGDIPAFDHANKTVSAIIFGEENTQKQIIITISYKVKGSTSVFTKQKSYDIIVNSSPINLNVSMFKEITSGQEFDITVSIDSNSKNVLKNVLLKVTYPFGYSFKSSDIKPLPDNATWKIGDLPPGGKKKIIIHGTLLGEDQDDKVFRFAVGSQSSRNANVIGTEYFNIQQDITLKKPFISLTMAVDGVQTDTNYAGRFEIGKRVEIEWFNNLSDPVSDVEITAKLNGSAFDKAMVNSNEGYYRSVTNEIIWSGRTNPELLSMAGGSSGRLSFQVTPKNLSSVTRQITNPYIDVSVSVSGYRAQESNIPQKLIDVLTKKIVVSTDLNFSSRVVRSIGPFANTGPIPPKAERETTYTILWTADSTVNSISGVQVTATLPPHIKWMGNISPDTEQVSFDANTGAITWRVGNIGAVSSLSRRTKQVAFQIAFEPSVTQIGSPAIVLNEATITGKDDFTGESLRNVQSYLMTVFSTDPSYQDGQGVVVQ